MKLAHLLPLLCFITLSAPATIYRWVDENGQVVYSQTPPPSGRAETVAPPPPPAESPEQARQRLDQQLKRLEELDEKRRKAREETQQKENQARKKAEICQRARQNLEILTSRPPNTLYKVGKEYKRFTPEERTKKIEQMKKLIKQTCDQ